MSELTGQPSVYELTDPKRIETYLRPNSALHLYEIGDLDPLFWPRTPVARHG